MIRVPLAAPAVFLPVLLCAQVRPPTGTSIEGVVKMDSSERRLPRVRVAVKKVDAKEAVTTITDGDGRFSLENLPPGAYTLTADREGYVRSSTVYDGTTATQSLMLWRPGQKVTGLVVRLKPGAVIAGAVRYRDGDPAIGVTVQVYLASYGQAEPRYLMAETTVTNDLGEYRIHSLPPGAYYIVARVRGASQASAHPVTTFYLDGGQLNQAVAVRVSAGQVVGGCDIVLGESKTYRVSGRVTSGVSGNSLRGPAVALRWLDLSGGAGVPAVQMDSSQGKFEVPDVAPGTYLLVASGSENGRKLTARQVVTVTDGAVDELDIVAGPVRKWKGKVRFEKPVDYDISSVRVRLEPRSDESPSVAVNADKSGEFEVELVPDETYDGFIEDAPADAFLKSLTVDGADTLGTGFRVSRNQDQRHLELVLSAQGGSVSGTVRLPAGDAAPGALVVVVPQPLSGRLQAVGASYSDESGRFLVRGLAPGQYLAMAWPDDTPCAPYDPAPPPECTTGGAGVRVDSGDVSGLRLVLSR